MDMTWIDKLIQKHVEANEDLLEGLMLAYNELDDIFNARHEDVDAWYAPRECHDLVGAGNDREEEYFSKKAEELGVSFEDVKNRFYQMLNEDMEEAV